MNQEYGDLCPVCDTPFNIPILVRYGEDTWVYEQKCKKCGVEVDYVPRLFIKEE